MEAYIMIMYSFLPVLFHEHNYLEMYPYWACRFFLGLCCSFFILSESPKPYSSNCSKDLQPLHHREPLIRQKPQPHHNSICQNLNFNKILRTLVKNLPANSGETWFPSLGHKVP